MLIVILILERNRSNKCGLGVYGALVMLAFYNPLMYKAAYFFFGSYSVFQAYYCRIMVCLCIPITIGYGLTLIAKRFKGKAQLLFVLLTIAIYCIYGKCVYDSEIIIDAYNLAKVPQEIVEITELFYGESGLAADDESIDIAVTTTQSIYLRQYEPRFTMHYSRSAGKNSIGDLLASTSLTSEEVYTVTTTAIAYGVDYILAAYSESNYELYMQQGYTLTANVTNYMVLEVPEKAQVFYTVTQYADASDSQANFYTICGNDGRFIVIDGGTVGNYEYASSILEEHGNKVDLWVISHCDPDHIGVLNEVLANGGVEITEIWDNSADYDYLETKANSWDGLAEYATYLSLIENFTQCTANEEVESGSTTVVRHIVKGDCILYNGLSFTFFNSYDASLIDEETTVYYYGDVFNNSSLVYKVEAVNSGISFLFVADVHGTVISDALMEEWGDALKSTYCNMGHHGNNTLSMEFYEFVDAQLYFFDAPEWLVYSEKYTTLETMQSLYEMGKEYVWWDEAPYTVTLY